MDLPVQPPLSPMLAKAVDGVPRGGDLLYEPKWDGFRCIVFRDGDEVELGSRNEKPLTRYFPELLGPLRHHLPERCVVDGELVVTSPHGLDFDALQQRLHPAASRVNRLAAETPASFVAFDLLAVGDVDLREEPFRERRRLLEQVLARTRPPVHLSPITDDPDEAEDWFRRFEGAGLDGVVAKPADVTYQPDKRVLFKVKHQRTADAVVAGYRLHKHGDGVGSFLMGLYDAEGGLRHVGVATGFTTKQRRALLEEIAPLEANALEGHPWASWVEAGMSAPSRWNATKDLSWRPLRPERVAEVAFTQLHGDRFRHASSFVRWRPDRTPASCTYDQLDVPVPIELHDVFGPAVEEHG